MWKLIILFVAAGGGGAGGDVEVIDYQTEATCNRAAEIINKVNPPSGSSVEAICVPAD